MAQINTEEWLAELDKVMEGTNSHTPIIADKGFTLSDLMAHKGLSRSRTCDIVKQKEVAGLIKLIGYRPGRNGPKVYEMVEKE